MRECKRDTVQDVFYSTIIFYIEVNKNADACRVSLKLLFADIVRILLFVALTR